MTPKNLNDVYFIALLEIARLTAPVEARKVSTNVLYGNEMMTRIKKIIASVEEEEDRFANARENTFPAHRDAIIRVHRWVASRNDDLTALEEVLSAYAYEHGREAYPVDLLVPNMKMATPAGLRKIINTCQYALAEHLRRAIGVE